LSSIGHLQRDCSGFVEEEVLEDTTLHREFQDSSPEADFYGTRTFHFAPEVSSQSESLEMLTGKLKYHCPALFSTLSLWERDTLDASDWLKNSTSKVGVSTAVDRELTEPDLVGTT
jgi:hypothetical protein